MKAIYLYLCLFLIGCSQHEVFECQTDTDCVPAECCHPTTCVPKDEAPSCEGMYCTTVCQPGSLDCGQGSCACDKGLCTTIIK